MNRIIVASLVTLAVLASMLWGNRLVGRVLDVELAQLLGRELGVPVHIAPIQARLPQLKANSAQLLMGDPNDPAVLATDVEIKLAWADLLRGEIRLVKVRTADLRLRPSRWPEVSNADEDLQFLEPWLPRSLRLDSATYISGDGDDYAVEDLRWRRRADGSAQLGWTQARAGDDLTVGIALSSLPDLLRLNSAAIDAQLGIAGAVGEAPVALQATLLPGDKSAYTLQVDLRLGDLTARIDASSVAPWQLPDQSTTTIPLLDIEQLLALHHEFNRRPPSMDALPEGLAAALPELALPAHRGRVVIEELRWGNEVGRDTAFDFTSGEHALLITGLTSSGPTGILSGGIDVRGDGASWTLDIDATMQARDATGTGTAQLGDSNWLWQTGHAKLDGAGDTWGSLLTSLRGDLSLAGLYHDDVETLVGIEAELDSRPGEFRLERLSISLGEGQLRGSAVLAGEQQFRLSANLEAARLDLAFLFDTEKVEPLPGIALPEYLAIMPQLELDLNIDIADFQTPGVNLRAAHATLERTASGGRLEVTAEDTKGGRLDLTLQADIAEDMPGEFDVTASFRDLDIFELFRRDGLLHSRSSGTLTFHGRGEGIEDVFAAMQGDADIAMDIRADNDWTRPANEDESLTLSGTASLVIQSERIVGVEIGKIDITSIEQDVTGEVSLVAGRSPWFIADLRSRSLNINSLLELLPESAEDTQEQELVPTLRRLGAIQVAIAVDALRVEDVAVSDLRFNLLSDADSIDIQQLDFTSENGSVKGQGKIAWTDGGTTIEGEAELSRVDLDQFLIRSETHKPVPVSGSARLVSEGSRWTELLANLTGHIDLASDTEDAEDAEDADDAESDLASRRRLALRATRLADGAQAEISSLQWGETDLSGLVRVHGSTPPRVEIALDGGTLSLLPWEDADGAVDDESSGQLTRTALGKLARSSADFVGNLLRAPLRLLSDDAQTKPGDKLFSSEPLPLASLQEVELVIDGHLETLRSRVIDARDLRFVGNVESGRLALTVSSDDFSGGSGRVELTGETGAEPATFSLTADFENVHGLTNAPTFPRTGYVSLDSQGQSTAELAANLDGLVFLELGVGPFDYANSTLLNADLATATFQILIPGIDRRQAQLECGITAAVFERGRGETPFGFAARTNQANMVGHIRLNLRNETIEMNIDSRGRQGLGLSVGSIFSSTVRVQGPITNPGLVPNATSLALRTLAAVSTGGMSILGETLVRRIWSSENPCRSIRRLITEDLCPSNPRAASSDRVCPQN